jgi:hypothetical protein
MIEILLKVALNTITLNGIHETERRTYKGYDTTGVIRRYHMDNQKIPQG